MEALTDITALPGQIFWAVMLVIVIIKALSDTTGEARPARRSRTAAEDAERESWLRSYPYKHGTRQ